MSESKPSSTLGNASLGLGLVSSTASFGIGLYLLVSGGEPPISLTGSPLWVGGITSVLMGFAAAGLGVIALFGKGRSKLTAVTGVLLGLLGAWIFFFVTAAVRNG